MDRQTAFHKVYNYFVVDGHPPSIEGDTQRCKFRTKSGRMCSLGVLIPTTKYHPSLEGKSVRELAEVMRPDWGEISDDLQFLRDLQFCHDRAVHHNRFRDDPIEKDWTFHQKIESNLRNLAQVYNLRIPNT